jgi:hypothetical protein
MTMSQLDVLESLEERVVPSLAARVTHARGDAAGRNTLRIALYSQDSLGLGHLRRTTHIGRRLLEAAPDSAVLLFADSPVAPFFELPDGMDCVKLPSILKVDAGRWRPTSLPILRRACHPLKMAYEAQAKEYSAARVRLYEAITYLKLAHIIACTTSPPGWQPLVATLLHEAQKTV